MKTKLFILSMLLMPVLFSCSKEQNYERWIVGNWYLSSESLSWAGHEEYDYDESYTKDEAEEFATFNSDYTYVFTSVSGTYSINGNSLILSPDNAGGNLVLTIDFVNKNHFRLERNEADGRSILVEYKRM